MHCGPASPKEPFIRRMSLYTCAGELGRSTSPKEDVPDDEWHIQATLLQTHYVNWAKLDSLLQSLFGQSHIVEAGTDTAHEQGPRIACWCIAQLSVDTISIQASRQLMEVRSF